jgi:hypothetical protein
MRINTAHFHHGGRGEHGISKAFNSCSSWLAITMHLLRRFPMKRERILSVIPFFNNL